VSVSQAAARVYAKALFDIGVEGGAADDIAVELRAVRNAIGGLDPQLQAFLETPQLHRDDKWQVMSLAFEGKVSRPVLGLLRVLVMKRREPLLRAIVDQFDELVDQKGGRVQADVVTARLLDADLADALRAALERHTQRQVVLHQRVDPNVIGGIRVSLGDLVVDGTIRRALTDMRRALASSLP
jgi:F-type H+-transporting ATPase subunit delta